jgi:Tfp pilus assembly ATPase PilU
MARSHGMFLATGPTGCGKSTTLYAMLLAMRERRINILTIEDPVEFHIEDVQQMQVNRAAGFTFASAMRNFLRHDPDAIMVGEIRDRETAANRGRKRAHRASVAQHAAHQHRRDHGDAPAGFGRGSLSAARIACSR